MSTDQIINEFILRKINLFYEYDDIKIENEVEFQLYNSGKIFLSFQIYSEHDEYCIYIHYLQKSKYSGKQILERLEYFVKYINFNLGEEYTIYTIQLNDESNIIIWDKYYTPLWFIYILQKGESWYNSLGYHDKEHKKNKLRWDELLSNNISVIFGAILNVDQNKFNKFLKHNFKDFKLIINSKVIDDIKITFGQKFEIEIEEVEKINIKLMFSMLYLSYKTKLNDEISIHLYHLLLITSYFIPYNTESEMMGFEKMMI